MQYKEDAAASVQYKEEYLKSIENWINKRQIAAASERREYCKDIFTDAKKYRDAFKAMLGWPLAENKTHTLPTVTVQELAREKDRTIYRMQFDILDGVQMTGLYFQKDDGNFPLVITQHGGGGTPELISGLHGDTANYNDMVTGLFSYDVNIFAPQLLLWDTQNYGVEHDRQALDAKLKRVGSSITALEVYGITRILDYFEKKEKITRFGMIGLSYGGFYTLFTTAVDTRIRAAISCAFFNTRDQYGWSDWTWFRSAQQFNDAEVACLVYPRYLCIAVGEEDELFCVNSAKEEMQALKSLCCDVGEDWLDLSTFKGTHEFYCRKEFLERFIQRLQ